jgi:hypothetical protein
MAKRRTDAVTQQIKRIEAAGDWIDLRLTMSYEKFLSCQDPETIIGKQQAMCLHLIAAWSFVGEDGEPLPINAENIADNFDAEIFFDVVAELNQLPFLQRMLARANQGS